MKKGKFAEIVVCICVIVIAVLLYKSTAHFPKEAKGTSVVYVRFLAIVFGILGFMQLIISSTAKYKLDKFIEEPKKFVILICSLIAYVFFMSKIGFIISTLVFLPVTMHFMGYKNKIKSIIISLGITFFVYILFVKIFEISLPAASFWG